MQLAINAQIPEAFGGLGGHAVYIGKRVQRELVKEKDRQPGRESETRKEKEDRKEKSERKGKERREKREKERQTIENEREREIGYQAETLNSYAFLLIRHGGQLHASASSCIGPGTA